MEILFDAWPFSLQRWLLVRFNLPPIRENRVKKRRSEGRLTCSPTKMTPRSQVKVWPLRLASPVTPPPRISDLDTEWSLASRCGIQPLEDPSIDVSTFSSPVESYRSKFKIKLAFLQRQAYRWLSELFFLNSKERDPGIRKLELGTLFTSWQFCSHKFPYYI